MGETLERVIPGVGTLTFENLEAGEWLTQKGEPSKRPRRRYMLDGQELDAVSSIVGTLDKPALRYWYETQGIIGAVRAQRIGALVEYDADGLLSDIDEAQVPAIVRKLRLGADRAKEEAADRGLVTHSALETLATTGEPPTLADYAPEVRPWITAAAKMWHELDPEPAESECIVCHPVLGYAGRLDFIAKINGRRTLLDYKSGKGKVYQEAHWQSRLYADALPFSGVEPVDDVVIVGLDDEGGFQLVKCAATSEDCAALVSIYRASKRINAAMASERKMVKVAA